MIPSKYDTILYFKLMCTSVFYAYPPHTRVIFLSHTYAHTLYIHQPSLSHILTLSPEVSLAHTLSRYITLPPSISQLSTTPFTSLYHKNSFTRIGTHDLHRPFSLYIYLPTCLPDTLAYRARIVSTCLT